MSDSNAGNHRTRRRAVRTAGPPIDETTTSESSPPDSTVVAVPGTVDTAEAKAAVLDAERPGDAIESGNGDVASTSAAADKSVSTDGWAGLDKTSTAAGQDAAAVGSEDKAAKRRPGGARIAVPAVSAVLAVALLVGAGLSVFAMRSADERDVRRTEYVQAARQAVVNLTTIRAESAKEDIDRILSVASGEFKTEFDGRVDPFTDIVQQVEIVSNGEVVDAALENDDENSARVLVAAKQTLTNAGEPQPQTRLYRFRVTVTRTDDGLKASKVEFVA